MIRPVFLLSPAHCGGRRAQMLIRPAAAFPLALRLRDEGIPIGEAFRFMSGLYFRGKLAYAERFADAESAFVIAPGRGLMPPHRSIGVDDLLAMASVPVDPADPRYLEPLRLDAERLASDASSERRIVLLGSIATDKYVGVLLACFGERLRFPVAFVGRGDMSRGGLMLRAAATGTELDYVPVAGAARRGARPPRLDPATRAPATTGY